MTNRPNNCFAARTGMAPRHRALRAVLIMMITALAAGTLNLAQTRRGAGSMMRGNLGFQREVFPPELVMRFQSEIGLSDEQEEFLIGEMQSLQSDLVPLQFEMSEAAGNVREALSGTRVKEDETLALAERLMSLEAQIKQRHLALMIRIKNALTPEQQEELRELREEFRERRGDRGRRPCGPQGTPVSRQRHTGEENQR